MSARGDRDRKNYLCMIDVPAGLKPPVSVVEPEPAPAEEADMISTDPADVTDSADSIDSTDSANSTDSTDSVEGTEVSKPVDSTDGTVNTGN